MSTVSRPMIEAHLLHLVHLLTTSARPRLRIHRAPTPDPEGVPSACSAPPRDLCICAICVICGSVSLRRSVAPSLPLCLSPRVQPGGQPRVQPFFSRCSACSAALSVFPAQPERSASVPFVPSCLRASPISGFLTFLTFSHVFIFALACYRSPHATRRTPDPRLSRPMRAMPFVPQPAQSLPDAAGGGCLRAFRPIRRPHYPPRAPRLRESLHLCHRRHLWIDSVLSPWPLDPRAALLTHLGCIRGAWRGDPAGALLDGPAPL